MFQAANISNSSLDMLGKPTGPTEAISATIADLAARVTICHQALGRTADKFFGYTPEPCEVAGGRGPSENYSITELLNFLTYEVEVLEVVTRRF